MVCFGFVCLHFFNGARVVLKETLQKDLVFKGESSGKEKLCATFGNGKKNITDANLPLGARKGNLEQARE